jgi:hypothetical protein
MLLYKGEGGTEEIPVVVRDVAGIKAGVEDLKAKKNAEQAQHLTEIMRSAAERWTEAEREQLRREASYREPRRYKYWGTCEICGEQFGAWRSDKQVCEKWACRKKLYCQAKKHGLGSHQANLKGFR